ncbi:MAG: SpoIIE family protein phosphatase [candidate division Zixibacteria bacterium]|jgi:serine phosphatase RsbU (regulator of sigma subunit)|nr:SpoIIE family protein phosphatase [candidate division Zixibacteria bacterium]
MLSLIGTDGEHYYTFKLSPGRFLVGRKSDCDICVPNGTVSRRHAEVEVDAAGKQVFVTDLGSHNGTTVNQVRVSARTELKSGDQIAFGSTEFRLSDSDQPSADHTRSHRAQLSDFDPEKSVFLDINEALKPLPQKASDNPELFPTLSEMARMLVLSEPREVMLERALGLVGRVVPADRLAILFTSEETGDVYTAATLLPGGKDLGSFTLSRTIIQQILDEKSAILVGDPTVDPRYAAQQSIILSELKSAMAAPLFDEGRVLGVLYVDTTNPMHRYNNDYLRLLAMFGNIIASRLLNYELLEEREEKQVMDAELNRAAGIQRRLLRVDKPELPGFSLHATVESSRSVGGDMYDFALLPDGRLLFLVADVSGKGMGAALLMANILASFRILYEQKPFDLLRTVEQVSYQLYKFSDPGDFATLFIGILDAETGAMTYINAGHNPPMLVRSDGTLELLEASGTMIGAFNFNTWQEAQATFRRGDVLFVFSDGVTEAEGPEGQYGEERTSRTLTGARHGTPAEITGELRRDIEQFIQGAAQSDDVTMLVVKKE